ncbi:hypothetical protein BB561_002507 [Smittium simulii]|uniref:Uncharacterized protein n=1 Tax=Smittium simulii TaxID=133385 RepID=A0A2T9YQ63_9FUNG|nr:hypothetical protein BB561_002507 [Smittium simulii]
MRGIHIKGSEETKRAGVSDKFVEFGNYPAQTITNLGIKFYRKSTSNISSFSSRPLNAEMLLRAQEQSTSKIGYMDINNYSNTTWRILVDFRFYSGLWTPYKALIHIDVKELLTKDTLEENSTGNYNIVLEDCNMVLGPTGTVYLTTTASTNNHSDSDPRSGLMKKSINLTESISAAQIVNYLAKIYSTDNLKPSTIKAYKSAILGLVKNSTEISNQGIFTEFFKTLNNLQ